MKKLFLACLLLLPLGGLLAQANAIEKYFQQYLEDERFTVVYISPKLFQMIDKIGVDELDLEDEEAVIFRDIAKDLRGLRILTTDVNPQQFFQEAKSKINTKEYEALMTVRQKKAESVEFLVRENNGVIEELLLLAGGEDSFALLSFVGKIDLEKVSRLAREMDKGEQ